MDIRTVLRDDAEVHWAFQRAAAFGSHATQEIMPNSAVHSSRHSDLTDPVGKDLWHGWLGPAAEGLSGIGQGSGTSRPGGLLYVQICSYGP